MSINTTMNTGVHARSMGVKLLVVCILAILMNIPGLFVQGLVSEQAHVGNLRLLQGSAKAAIPVRYQPGKRTFC